MQRWITTLLGIAVVVLSLWIVALNFHAPHPGGHDPASSAADGGLDGGGLLFALSDAGVLHEGDAGAAMALTDMLDRDLGATGANETDASGVPGTVMPDGAPVPRLPLGVPRQVRFGVALVSYAGSQPPLGGHSSARSRADARVLADRLYTTAQQDFRAAVQQGDMGSIDDAGQVKPGILEPAPEYVLYTLPVGAIGGPVDTPRGYWIVKRLE
jgi:hypothetical protein